MKLEIWQEWIAALRSGKYKQGQHYLRRKINGEDYFCCLGVLCDIIDPKEWEELTSTLGESTARVFAIAGRTGCLPEKIDKAVGGCIPTTRLIDMNDSGRDFEEIANFLESDDFAGIYVER